MLSQISFPQRAVSPTPPSQKPVLKSQISDLSSVDVNKIIRSTELVDQQWFPWHAKAVKALGPTKYLDIADLAKTGNNPRTLFSHLLKQEMVK